MAIDKWMVEVYDSLTGEHYERECTPEELVFYEQLEKEQIEAPTADAPNLNPADDPA